MVEKKIDPAKVAELLHYDNESEGIARAYLELGMSAADNAEDIADEIEESYAGRFDTDEEFAQEMADNTGVVIGTEWPLYCIDWEYAARELMFDYSMQDHYYFRNL